MSDSDEDLEDGPVLTAEDIGRQNRQLSPVIQSLPMFDPTIQGKIDYLNGHIEYTTDERIQIFTYVYQPAEFVINVIERIVFRINLSFDVNGAWARITKNPSGGGESFIDVTSKENCVSTMHTLLHETYISTMYELLQRDHPALFKGGKFRVSPARRLIQASSKEKRSVKAKMITDIIDRISIMIK